jgi:hypothetical protein
MRSNPHVALQRGVHWRHQLAQAHEFNLQRAIPVAIQWR